MNEHSPRSTADIDGDAPLESVVDEAIARSNHEKVSLRAVMSAWGDRSYGPAFILLGFFAGTPLAVIPGAAAVVGLVIAALAVQMAFGKIHPWLPDIALRQSVSEKRLRQARRKSEPVLALIDNLITERFPWAASDIVRRIAAIIVALLGLAMTPFDAVPVAVAAPAWTVVLFGVAITARDGLVMMLAIAACVGVGYLAFRIF